MLTQPARAVRDARGPDRPAHDGARTFEEAVTPTPAPQPSRDRARPRRAAASAGLQLNASSSSTKRKASSHCSTAAATRHGAGGSDLSWQAAAPRRRHDLPERQRRLARRGRRHGTADRDARGRALQPHGAHPRQGHSGEGRAERRDEVLTTRRRRTASTSSRRLPGTDPVLKDEVVLLGAHFDSVAAANRRHRQRRPAAPR